MVCLVSLRVVCGDTAEPGREEGTAGEGNQSRKPLHVMLTLTFMTHVTATMHDSGLHAADEPGAYFIDFPPGKLIHYPCVGAAFESSCHPTGLTES